MQRRYQTTKDVISEYQDEEMSDITYDQPIKINKNVKKNRGGGGGGVVEHESNKKFIAYVAVVFFVTFVLMFWLLDGLNVYTNATNISANMISEATVTHNSFHCDVINDKVEEKLAPMLTNAQLQFINDVYGKNSLRAGVTAHCISAKTILDQGERTLFWNQFINEMLTGPVMKLYVALQIPLSYATSIITSFASVGGVAMLIESMFGHPIRRFIYNTANNL